MSSAEDRARQQGCSVMTLEVFAGDATARGVYARLGYHELTLKLAKRPGQI
jgi:GNAT superfamily N-acetyltransferase